jgi:hypothetical protein
MVPVPDPTYREGVTWPKLLVVPHSNQAVVALPPALTVPTNVAESPAMLVGCDVATVGAERVLGGNTTLKVILQF